MKVLVPGEWPLDKKDPKDFANYLGVDAYFNFYPQSSKFDELLWLVHLSDEGSLQIEVANHSIASDAHSGGIHVQSPDEGLIGSTNTAERLIVGPNSMYARVVFHNTNRGRFFADYRKILYSFEFERCDKPK